jgi:hypothetical protein
MAGRLRFFQLWRIAQAQLRRIAEAATRRATGREPQVLLAACLAGGKAGRLNRIFVAAREVSLFVFMLDLESALRDGSVVRR